MKIIYLNRKKYSTLKEMFLNKNIISTEAKTFLLNDGMLFKQFYQIEGDYFSDKMYTLSMLDDAREKVNDDRFIFPRALISFGGKIVGYVMPFIAGENLDNILNNVSLKQDVKIRYLKEAGEIVAKMDNIRKIKGLENFYLGDIHSQNFMVDNDGVKIIDMDSVRIGKLDGFPIKNSFPVRNFKLFKNKYLFKNNLMVATRNSDISMYNLMVLNFISGERMQEKNLDDYFSYLNFLEKQGMKKEIVDEFAKIFSDDDGKIIGKLSDIKDPVGKYSYKIYDYKKEKTK